MGDAGAIKAGDAYVEMTLDKSKLDKGLSDAGKGADKPLAEVDARTKQLTSSLYRMTGAITLLRVAGAAIEGAFTTMAAQKAGDRAWYRGDLQGQVAAMRKAEEGQESWLRSIPVLGGAIGKLFDAFKDRSIEEFAQQLEAADRHGQSLSDTLTKLASAQVELAKARGESPEQIAKLEEADKHRLREEELGKKKAAYDEAVRNENEINSKLKAKKSERTGPAFSTVEQFREGGYLSKVFNPLGGRKVAQMEALEAESAKALVVRVEAQRDLKAFMNVRKTASETAAITEGKAAGTPSGLVGMQPGAELAGVGAGQVAWGVGATDTQSPQSQLVDIQTAQSGKLDEMTQHLAMIAMNTTKPPTAAYGATGSW